MLPIEKFAETDMPIKVIHGHKKLCASIESIVPITFSNNDGSVLLHFWDAVTWRNFMPNMYLTTRLVTLIILERDLVPRKLEQLKISGS